jgi:hypothetical protein
MAVSDSNRNTNRYQNHPQRCSQLVSANYCRPGIMSRCSAGIVWENQKKCKYSKKSSVSDRCMHDIESLDGHCDCVDAQRES